VTVSGSISSIERIWASRGKDNLSGRESADDRLYGWEGDDVIDGLSGNDNVSGGQGNDIVYGGLGDDVVGGGPGADFLYGDDGDDVVSGAESGVGDLTDDVLWGGNGIDVFHFRANFGTDTIMDYEQDEQIHLTDYVGGFWRNDFSLDVININDVGDDIVVDFWLKRGGGTGGTIILKGAAAAGIVFDKSHFIID
ncbi:MAG: Ca2+-binding RTX toxin-like protein, partial [Woeseiaceae bacterium]